MEMLSFASASLTLAIFLIANTASAKSGLALGSSVLGTLAVIAFYLGLSPPQLVRLWWRYPEQLRLQHALSSLLTFAESQEEVAGRVLRTAAELVGARTLSIRNAQGVLVGTWSAPGDGDAASEPVEIAVPNGPTLELWTSPYAPFFGEDELGLLQTLGALTGVALDRVRLFEAEHEARLALERANEVQASFIALAAHELRTPMTTIHGFVTTLHHLADRLDDQQTEQVKVALLQQTQRMANLIEQLLDLSRVDADAIAIEPKPLAVRAHVREIVEAAATEPSAVEVDVAEDLVATVDRSALERIVSNLVTNAFRYGRPPVVVRAEQTDRHFRLTVQDSGPGVSAEFVPDLFERFSRSESSRASVTGTGLGLAIARSYARAHGGDLLYESGVPQGARFQLVLPQRGSQ
jgi:signal transduction histidine kinase